MGVELASFAANRDGEVEPTARGQYTLQGCHETEACMWIDWIGVPSQTEMFGGMKT